MELKYVGAKPIVSQHGVSFDKSKPDSYTFLQAAVELLEALSFESSDNKRMNLYNISTKELSAKKLTELLKKYCNNINDIFDSREEKTNELIKKYINQVKENSKLTPDERKAWLGNVAIMRDYYLQYVTNESAYDCALDALADKIHQAHIEEIVFPLGRNHGLVLSHLIPILTDRKPPYDAMMTAMENDSGIVGLLNMNRSKPLDI